MKPASRATFRRRLGVAMMVSSLGLAGSMIGLAPAGAQQGEPETVTLEVVKSAYYSTSLGRGAPNTVTSEFPPGVVCIVRPQLCPEEGAEVFGAIGEQIGTVEDVPTGPATQVQPGTLPVGTHQGETAYRSAILTTLPEIPADQEVDRFVLRLVQDSSQSFHTSSPMFRQAVLAALASYQQGGFAQEEFEKALASDPVDRQITGVEACPITTDFEGEDNQPEEATPEVDCLFGSNGVFIEDENVWEFDLSFAATAWADGTLPNLGVLLRPTAAPNLAYGDKDFTASSRVVFKPAEGVEAAVVKEEKSAPPAPFTPAPSNNSSAPTFSNSPSYSGGIQSSPIFAPEVAPEPAAQAAPPLQTETVAAVPFVPQEPGSAWWMWLLVPIFLAGMYLTSQSLTEEVVLAGQRDGAMSRLLERTGGAAPSTATPGPRQGAMSRLVQGT